MSGGGWMFLWLMVALKVPICALLYLVWWATRPPEPADAGSEDWKKPRVGPDHPRPRRRGGGGQRGVKKAACGPRPPGAAEAGPATQRPARRPAAAPAGAGSPG